MTTNTPAYPKRLIEVDLPIKSISKHARHEQDIRKGHLHTLHMWWATRPLAACRGVLLATILPDPVDEHCPKRFREEAIEALAWKQSGDLSDPWKLREALLAFIGEFASWDLSNDTRWVNSARALVRAAHPDGAPMVVDPFAGLGSIPFEALRIGADSSALDLNPVTVLALKAGLDYLPSYGIRLAELVQKWSNWVRERAYEQLKEFYPQEPGGSIQLAYLWARTIRCEGPGCGVEIPLLGLVSFSGESSHKKALRYSGDAIRNEILVEAFEPYRLSDVQQPIVRRFAVTCPLCQYTTPYKRVREQIRAKGGGTSDARMLAVVTRKPDGSRGFRSVTGNDVLVEQRARDALKELRPRGSLVPVPDEPFPTWYSGVFNPGLWNITTWGGLFTARQALTLNILGRAIVEAHQLVVNETDDKSLGVAVATCLGLGLSKLTHYNSSLSFYWRDRMISAFIQGSGLAMRPDFAEANPFVPQLAGGFQFAMEQVIEFLKKESHSITNKGTVWQGSATNIPLPDQSIPYVVTDPPYYAAVPYSHLSDFFYVWLKRAVGDLYPDLFIGNLTPKQDEIVAYYVQPKDEQSKDATFFEHKMTTALAECKRVLKPDGLAVVLFAHKGTAGWEALINAIIQAGMTVTSSWPIETERGGRMRAQGSAVLQSTVFLVCRPRLPDAGVGDWREVLSALYQRVGEWLPRLAEEGINGADAIFACIGPALVGIAQIKLIPPTM